MKKKLRKDKIYVIGLVVCALFAYLFSVIGIHLWVKGYDASDYLEGISYFFLCLYAFLAIIMIITGFRRIKLVKAFVILIVSTYIIINHVLMWSSGRQVGGYFEIVDKEYNDDEYYLVLGSGEVPKVICDENTYDVIDTDKKYMLNYRAINDSKQTAYLMSIHK